MSNRYAAWKGIGEVTTCAWHSNQIEDAHGYSPPKLAVLRDNESNALCLFWHDDMLCLDKDSEVAMLSAIEESRRT